MTYDLPCPHCGETGHQIEERDDWPGAPIVICPKLEFGSLLLIAGKIIRDNRDRFKPKQRVSSNEFPEFSDALDFFDAETIIEI